MSATQDPFKHEPIKQRPGRANNRPGSLAHKPGWNDPIMKAAKMVAYNFSEHRAGSLDRLVFGGKWGKLGINRMAMLAAVRQVVGGFDDHWAETRNPSRSEDVHKAQDLYNRVYHMCTEYTGKTKKRIRCVSSEHQTRHTGLLPYVEVAREITTEGRLVPRAEIVKKFSGKVL